MCKRVPVSPHTFAILSLSYCHNPGGCEVVSHCGFDLYVSSEVAPPSSTLAWKSPWAEEPGRLQSMGSLGVGHDFTFTFMHWRRKWQPTPVFLPGESQGRGRLVGCRLWGCTESDTTEVTWQQQQQSIKYHKISK